MTFGSAVLLAAVTVCTWNGEWFPSGRAEHRDTPENEARTIAAAARMLSDGFARVDPAGTNDLILCLNEIRNPLVADSLVKAIGRTNLSVAVISGYRRRDRFDMQQDVIATTLPVVEANWSTWRNARAATPPRGYAHANVLISPTVTASVYAVHLKSNYGQTTEAQAVTNRLKRTLAIGQLLAQEKPKSGRASNPMIIAGDMNADKWDSSFAQETIFTALAKARFTDPLERLDPRARVTHPGRGRFGDSVLDYVFIRLLQCVGNPLVLPAEGLSDHNPVFVVVKP